MELVSTGGNTIELGTFISAHLSYSVLISMEAKNAENEKNYVVVRTDTNTRVTGPVSIEEARRYVKLQEDKGESTPLAIKQNING